MPQLYFYTLIGLIGLCFGSFANVVIYRLPRNESIVRPPSHCPACDRRLTGFDLIPLLSFILLKGRCRYCGVRISLRYPVVEAACAFLFIGMTLYTDRAHLGLSLSLIPLCALAFMLLCISIIDNDTQTIPDGLLLFGAAAALLWVGAALFFPRLCPLAPLWYDALLGAAAGALPLFFIDRLTLRLLKKDGFGFGDVKLMAVCGLFLGGSAALLSLFFAFITGGVYAAFLIASGRARRGAYMAFGPFLALGVLFSLWFGDAIMCYNYFI